MKAIILVAGYATRLYPLTIDTPKALLPIGGKPIIDYIVDEINTISAVDSICVVSNHKFIEHFNKWKQTVVSKTPIVVLDDGTSTEQTRRGAIGDILFALDSCAIDDDLMVIAGDNFFTYTLKSCYEFFLQKGSDVVVAKQVNDREALKQFAVATLDKTGKIVELEEKPNEPKSDVGIFATYLYTKETARLFQTYMDEGNNKDAPGYFVQWLYKRKPVFAYPMEGDCYDIGTKASYDAVCAFAASQNTFL